MLGIVKKDSLFFLIALFVIYPSILILWKLFGKTFEIQFVVFVSFLIHILLYGPMIINEQDEDKSKGYSFLTTLPVKLYEIVCAKFSLVFVSVLFLLLVNWLIFSLTIDSENLFLFARNILIISLILCLIVTALFYIGIFAFGFFVFFRYGVLSISVILLSGGVVAQFLLIKKINILGSVIAVLSHFIQNLNLNVLVLSGIVLYAGLMVIAVKVKSLAGLK